MSLFQLFHQQTKHGHERPSDPHDTSWWPESWRVTQFKEYERFPRITLPRPSDLEVPIGRLIRARRSARSYDSVLSEQDLSSLIWYSCGETDSQAIQGRGRRASASAGGRYPLETYILLFKPVGTIAQGTYHYAVRTHELELMGADVITAAKCDELFRYPESKEATGAIVLCAVFARETQKYHERGYRHILLEAGGIVEQATLVAGALGMGSVAMCGFQDAVLEDHLGVDGTTESVVHSIIFG